MALKRNNSSGGSSVRTKGEDSSASPPLIHTDNPYEVLGDLDECYEPHPATSKIATLLEERLVFRKPNHSCIRHGKRGNKASRSRGMKRKFPRNDLKVANKEISKSFKLREKRCFSNTRRIFKLHMRLKRQLRHLPGLIEAWQDALIGWCGPIEYQPSWASFLMPLVQYQFNDFVITSRPNRSCAMQIYNRLLYGEHLVPLYNVLTRFSCILRRKSGDINSSYGIMEEVDKTLNEYLSMFYKNTET